MTNLKKSTWAFLVVQVLFVIWIIAGAHSGTDHSSCVNDPYLSVQTCSSAQDAGTAIGVALVVFLWAIVDIIWGVITLVVRTGRK